MMHERPAETARRDQRRGRLVSIAVALLGMAALLAVLVPAVMPTMHSSSQPVFWDAAAYARALHAYQSGGNPYARDTAYTFVYSPAFLLVADGASRLLHGALAWRVYLLATLLALLSIPFLLSEGYFRSQWFSPGVAVALFIVHPLFTTIYVFKTGNIATTLYALVLVSAIPGMRRNRWGYCYFAVAIAASIKLPILAFLLLPLLLGEGKALGSGVTAGAVLAFNAVQRAAEPAAYQAYLQAIRYQVTERDSVGVGVFASVLHLQQRYPQLSLALPLLAHSLVAGMLVAGTLWARTRGALRDQPQWFVALTVLLALLLNPRMVAYDLAMLVLPMAFLVGELLRALVSGKVAACLMLALLGCWFGLGSRALVACYVASLACFPVAAWLWWTGAHAYASRGNTVARTPMPA